MTARALIADDEPRLAENLRDRLRALWPELEILPLAANGLEALRAINEDEPDVAFLDIRMPGLTGIELAKRVDTNTHIVFVTAFDQYAVEAFDREVVDYLLKPVADERLARCVERLQKKLATDEKPPPLDEMLAKLSRALPGASGKLRWIRASKGELVHQIPVDDVLYFQASDPRGRVADPPAARGARGAARRRRVLADPSRHRREHERGLRDSPRPQWPCLREAEGREDGVAGEPRVRAPVQADVSEAVIPAYAGMTL